MSGTTHKKTLRTFRDWRTGEGMRQRGMNRTHDVIRDLQGGVDQPMQVPSIARGVPTEEEEEDGGSTRAFRLGTLLDEMYRCFTYAADGTIDSDEVLYVAKPHTLRRSTYAGKTINGIKYTYLTVHQRRAHKVGTSIALDEIQVIVPSWNVGDTITASLVQYTGVIGLHDFGRVLWQDVNDGARAFAFARSA